jgi:hypothetical protein
MLTRNQKFEGMTDGQLRSAIRGIADSQSELRREMIQEAKAMCFDPAELKKTCIVFDPSWLEFLKEIDPPQKLDWLEKFQG